MSETKRIIQVPDDKDLLKLMMEDLGKATELYKPTNFWHVYETRSVPELLSIGLKNFRGRSNLVFGKLGGADLYPFSDFLETSSKDRSLSVKAMQFSLRTYLKFKKLQTQLSNINRENSNDFYHGINMTCFKIAKSFGEKNGAKPIHNIEDSLVGNPENIFFVDGKSYTNRFLDFYVQYAYCCKFMNFEKINSIMEIGSGAGRQVEVLKKLHPHLCFYLFDISPQLYVCGQYLSTIFPDSVVSYRETRELKKIPKPEAGKIFIFGNWKLPQIENLQYDMFWNSNSFQEMEPSVVANYLKFVNKQSTKYAFLQEIMRGKQKASKKGKVGVIEQTKLEHYMRGLSNFKIIDISRAILLPRLSPLLTTYKSSFWKRK